MDFTSNKENECVETIDGQKIWVSRSVAVIMHLVIKFQYDFYVVTTLRGSGANDHNGKWCLPCGFLDWDESGAQGAARELFEETSINVNELSDKIIYDGLSLDDPWKVVTDPKADDMQNVCLHYGLVIGPNAWGDINRAFSSAETAKVETMKVDDFVNLPESEVAFGHNHRLEQFMHYLKTNHLV